MTTDRLAQWRNTAATDECHDHIDPIGGCDFCEELVPDARLSRCVGEQRGVEQRNQRRVELLWLSIRSPSANGSQKSRGIDRLLRDQSIRGRNSGNESYQLAGNVDTDPDARILWETSNGPFDDRRQVQRYAISRFSCTQFIEFRLADLLRISKALLKRFGEQDLVQATRQGRHSAKNTPRTWAGQDTLAARVLLRCMAGCDRAEEDGECTIAGRQLDGIQFPRLEPLQIRVLEALRLPLDHDGCEVDDEDGPGVPDRKKRIPKLDDGHSEFFSELSLCRLEQCFIGLELSAGKLP